MIKNIIFDLGGVLLDLDIQGSMHQFEALGAKDLQKQIHKYGSQGIFGQLEHGEIDEDAFFEGLRTLLKEEVSNDELKSAWNIIIKDFPLYRMQMIDRLKDQYNLYVLSNTSILHANVFEGLFYERMGKEMQTVFKQIFYSHEMGISKPKPGIYQKLIQESGINPSETVFIDDSEANIHEALNHGIHGLYKPGEEEVANLDFNNLENNPKFVSAK